MIFVSELQRVATTAERLQQAMAEAKLKQVDVVRITGMHKGTLNNYVKGKYEPKSNAIHILAKALGVSEMWLWGYDVPKQRSDGQKKNDQLVELITLLRKDNEFAEMVQMLSELTPEQKDSVKQFLTVFTNK